MLRIRGKFEVGKCNHRFRLGRNGDISDPQIRQSTALLLENSSIVGRGCCGINQAIHSKMDTKLGEMWATSNEVDEPVNCSAGGCFAGHSTQFEDLQLWHCLREVGDNVIIYPRRATSAIARKPYLEGL